MHALGHHDLGQRLMAPRLRLLGEPAWQGADGAHHPLFWKDAALLARLALEGPQPRQLLCALLWPELPAARADDNARQRASRLNRAAGFRVVVTGESWRLDPAVAVDATRLSELDTETLLAAGPLLGRMALPGCEEAEAWLAQARERIAGQSAAEFAGRAEAAEGEGRLRHALPLAQRVAELLPQSEHAARRLMRLHYLRGDGGAAQEAYWRLEAVLRSELGLRPGEETQQLLQTIELARSVPAPVQPQRPVPTSLREPPLMVGRSDAQHAMAAAWDRGQPVLVVGEAGLGKSRLLREFLRGREGVAEESARPGDERSPYAVLGRALLGVQASFAPELRPAVREQLAHVRSEFGSAPQAPAHGPLLWRAMQSLLESALRAGLVAIVIDDLHNADDASIEALRWLSAAPALAALRIGLAARPHPGLAGEGALAAWLADSQRPQRVDLMPLSAQDLDELLATLALPSLLDKQVAAQLYRHAGGHPLFTLATLQDAIVRGQDLRGAAWPHPGTVQALLDERLRTLPESALDLLRVAAVAGPDLTVERASRLLDTTVLALADRWAALEDANVLRGEAFSHDLMHEAALRAVPLGVRQALHRSVAALLDEDGGDAARVAWHWEQGERWIEAAACWSRAALSAGQAGRRMEQVEMYERAADLYQRGGNESERVEALLSRLDALRSRRGTAARLEAAAVIESAPGLTQLQRLRSRLAQVSAHIDEARGATAVEAAATAVRDAAYHPEWLYRAHAVHAETLAQAGRFEQAQEAVEQGLKAADAAGQPDQRLRVLSAGSYVLQAAGQLPQAVDWQLRALTLAESVGDLSVAAHCEGNVAALLESIGDVPGTYERASRTRRRQREAELVADGTLAAGNQALLGVAAAALGRFGEAIEALEAAVALAGPGASALVRSKARIGLARVWLTLGRADAALELVDRLSTDGVPWAGMQAELVRARAAELAGRSAQRHWERMVALGEQQLQLALMQSAWFEWSFAADAASVLARLPAIAARYESLGMHGVARALRWRELVRRLECADAAGDAHALALRLHPHADCGLSAKCYPPQTWCTLAEAYARAGDEEKRTEALASARSWMRTALQSVPPAHRATFMQAGVNRALLEAGGSP